MKTPGSVTVFWRIAAGFAVYAVQVFGDPVQVLGQPARRAPESYFSEADAKTVAEGPVRESTRIIDRIASLAQGEGKDVWRPFIPAMITRFETALRRPQRLMNPGQSDDGVLGDIPHILADLGDPRALPVFLESMVSRTFGGSSVTARALVNIGRTAVPPLLDSLRSVEPWSRRSTAVVVRFMEEANPSFFTSADRQGIRERLVDNLSHEDVLVRQNAARGLGVFGDSTTVLILQHAATTDPDSGLRGTTVRTAAGAALETLRQRLARPASPQP